MIQVRLVIIINLHLCIVILMFSLQHPCGAFGCHHAGRSQLTEEEGSGRSAAWLIIVFCFFCLGCFIRWSVLMIPKCKCFFIAMNVVIFKICCIFAKERVDISKSLFIYPCCTFKLSLRLKLSFHKYTISILSFIFF